jgi:hypothetical protein
VIKRASSFLRAGGLEAGDEVQVFLFFWVTRRGSGLGLPRNYALLWLVIAKTAGEQPPNAALEQQPDGA